MFSLMQGTLDSFHPDLKMAVTLLYQQCGFVLTHPKINKESTEYAACSFELDGQKIEHRLAKITPTKTGQFVTIWKRNTVGVTVPFDRSDDFDFIIISARSGAHFGQFIFPKMLLADKCVISREGKEGKRGVRVLSALGHSYQ